MKTPNGRKVICYQVMLEGYKILSKQLQYLNT